MQSYSNAVASTSTGLPVSAASVQVNLYPSGTAATIYSSNSLTATKTNPISTAADGSFFFFAKNGWYTLTITVGGTPVTSAPFLLEDLTDTDGSISTTWAVPGAIGATTPNAGAFTTLSASNSITGPIGGVTPNSGAFTTLSASGVVSGAGFSAYLASPPAIGGSAPNTGAFTKVALSAGTATVAPINFTAGVLLTSAAAGAEEFDGAAFYKTPVTSNRGVNLTEHFVNNSTAQTGANVNTAQPWFVTTLTNGQITLPASTTYEFEGILAVSTTGATSHSIAIGFGGTATLTSIGYVAEVSENATSLATLSAVSRLFLNTAASTAVTTAVATATYDTIKVTGTVRINAGGTFIPQFTYSAAPGVAPTIAIGTYFRMRPLGSNAVTNVGNWS